MPTPTGSGSLDLCSSLSLLQLTTVRRLGGLSQPVSFSCNAKRRSPTRASASHA